MAEQKLVERVSLRRRLRRARPLAWAAEVSGVGVLSVAGAQIESWLGLMVVGVYLVLLANVERDDRRSER